MRLQNELADVTKQLSTVKANLDAMETIMQRQLKDLNTQLHEAKEEIAVKVAQVKQYQKQVEAYKQQVQYIVLLHRLCFHYVLIILPALCHCTFLLCYMYVYIYANKSAV